MHPYLFSDQLRLCQQLDHAADKSAKAYADIWMKQAVSNGLHLDSVLFHLVTPSGREKYDRQQRHNLLHFGTGTTCMRRRRRSAYKCIVKHPALVEAGLFPRNIRLRRCYATRNPTANSLYTLAGMKKETASMTSRL